MPRVFISYSHDSEGHKARVASLAQRLRANDLTVVLDSDMLPGGPREGWPQWSERQVTEADFVLVACTPTYSQRCEGDQPQGEGLGAICEARAIRQFLYDQAALSEYAVGLKLANVLAAHDPTNAQWQDDLTLAQSVVNRLKTALGNSH